MPLEFEAGDRLTVGSMVLPERLPDERRAVDGAEDPVWVASKGVNTDDVATTRDALDAAGVAYRLRTIGDMAVFDRFAPDVRPWDVGLSVPFAG